MYMNMHMYTPWMYRRIKIPMSILQIASYYPYHTFHTGGYSIFRTRYFGDCQVLSCLRAAVWDELYGVSASTPSISPRGFFSTASSPSHPLLCYLLLSLLFLIYPNFALSGLSHA